MDTEHSLKILKILVRALTIDYKDKPEGKKLR